MHNGLFDLVFLYAALYEKPPKELDIWQADMHDMFPYGVFDTKYFAEFEAREGEASFLAYLYARNARLHRDAACTAGGVELERPFANHVVVDSRRVAAVRAGGLVATPSDCQGAGVAPIGTHSDVSAWHRPVCSEYAAHGNCSAGRLCSKSHDLEDVLDRELGVGSSAAEGARHEKAATWSDGDWQDLRRQQMEWQRKHWTVTALTPPLLLSDNHDKPNGSRLPVDAASADDTSLGAPDQIDGSQGGGSADHEPAASRAVTVERTTAAARRRMRRKRLKRRHLADDVAATPSPLLEEYVVRPRQQVPPSQPSKPLLQPDQPRRGSHRAGYDAYMTGFVFSSFWARFGAKRLQQSMNKISLSGKDFPLLLVQSRRARLSEAHQLRKAKRRVLNSYFATDQSMEPKRVDQV